MHDLLNSCPFLVVVRQRSGSGVSCRTMDFGCVSRHVERILPSARKRRLGKPRSGHGFEAQYSWLLAVSMALHGVQVVQLSEVY